MRVQINKRYDKNSEEMTSIKGRAITSPLIDGIIDRINSEVNPYG